MTVLAVELKNKREADLVASFIHKMRKDAKILMGAHWDDFQFGKLIDEGMKEESEVPLKEFRTKLTKQIKALEAK